MRPNFFRQSLLQDEPINACGQQAIMLPSVLDEHEPLSVEKFLGVERPGILKRKRWIFSTERPHVSVGRQNIIRNAWNLMEHAYSPSIY
ncbi:MAG: hypothetical protein WD468_08995 [Pirellulales bacterium]